MTKNHGFIEKKTKIQDSSESRSHMTRKLYHI